MTGDLLSWVQQVVGDHKIVDTPAQTAHKAASSQRVVKVVDAAGQGWFAKHVEQERAWRAEVHAYRHWVPALNGLAPRLEAADPELRALVVTALPGARPSPTGADHWQQAGALLRLLHEARPSVPRRAPVRGGALKLAQARATAGRLFTRDELAFVEACATRIADLPIKVNVPCHGDYRQHNLLLDASGILRVIDFGDSGWDIAASDLSVSFYGPLWRRPDLAERFLDGYGRPLTDPEREFIQRRVAVTAVLQAAFGHRNHSRWHTGRGHRRLAALMEGHEVITW
jgi:Ser/Thr protein kinase RdoA (MazF antagonist)